MNPRAASLYLLLALATALSGCGNFDFRVALLPDGKYDLPKLIAEVERREQHPLVRIAWIPLLRTKAVGFGREPGPAAPPRDPRAWRPDTPLFASEAMPSGYSLAEMDGFGPLFAFLRARESYYDDSGQGYEVREARVFLWRLWGAERSVVRTSYGEREERRFTLLFGLLGGFPQVRYAPPAPQP
jgi:hypothetical protein